MNRIKEILECEFNLIISPRTIDRLLKAENEILKHYISKEDVKILLESVQGIEPMVLLKLKENLEKVGGSNEDVG